MERAQQRGLWAYIRLLLLRERQLLQSYLASDTATEDDGSVSGGKGWCVASLAQYMSPLLKWRVALKCRVVCSPNEKVARWCPIVPRT